MSVIILSARDKQKKYTLVPCPHVDYSTGTENCGHYLHFIVEESES